MRSRTKSKEAKNRFEARQTGGGGIKNEVLTTVEEEVLQVIKKVSIEGHDNEESMVTFSFDDEENRFTTSSPTEVIENFAITPHIEERPMEQKAPIEPSMSETSSRKKKTKKLERVLHSSAAVSIYEKYLQDKLKMKKEYYYEKVQHFKNIEILKQKKLGVLQTIAHNLKFKSKQLC